MNPNQVEEQTASILPPIIITVNGKTYDLTNFNHPGGMKKLRKHNGEDVSELFVRVHKMEFPEEKMSKYFVENQPPVNPYECN